MMIDRQAIVKEDLDGKLYSVDDSSAAAAVVDLGHYHPDYTAVAHVLTHLKGVDHDSLAVDPLEK